MEMLSFSCFIWGFVFILGIYTGYKIVSEFSTVPRWLKSRKSNLYLTLGQWAEYLRMWILSCDLIPQFSSIAQSCPTLCNAMDCSMPGFPVQHQLSELAQPHVCWAVMPSNHLILCHPLFLPPSIFPSIKVFSDESVLWIWWPKYWSFSFSMVLPMNIQDWFPLEWTGWISLLSKGLSKVFSNTTVQKHQFFGTQLSSQANSHIHSWPLEKP